MKLSKYKAVLFDLDGVLIDSKDVHYRAFSEALLTVTGFSLSKSDHTKRFCGLPTIEKLKILQKENSMTDAEVLKVFEIKQSRTLDLIEKQDFYREDIYHLISELSAHKFKIAVCSNTTRPTLDIILESLCINRFLSLSLSSNDVKLPKPAPDIFIKAMSHLQASPEETLILEDSIPGLEAAKSSGADFLTIKSPDFLCETVYDFFQINPPRSG